MQEYTTIYYISLMNICFFVFWGFFENFIYLFYRERERQPAGVGTGAGGGGEEEAGSQQRRLL